jgi:hypothetical protein
MNPFPKKSKEINNMKKLALYLVIIIGVLTIGYLAMNPQSVNAIESDVITTSTYQQPYRVGGMMGYRTGGGVGGCYNTQITDPSYEWQYLHLSDIDQALVDAKYAELLQAVDLSSLTTEEVVAVQNDIKTQLIAFIETEGYVFIYRPY